MKSFPSLLRLLLVVGLCVVVDGHNYLRGGGDTRKSGVRRFRMRQRMMMMMMMKRKKKDPEPPPQDETLPPRRKRDTTPGRFQNTTNIFASLMTKLEIELAATDLAPSNGNVTFDILVSNTGNVLARNVLVTDELQPSEGTFLSSDPPGHVINSKFTIMIGELAPDEAVQVTVLWLAPSNEATLTNLATASADNANKKTDERDLDIFVSDGDPGDAEIEPACTTSEFETQVNVFIAGDAIGAREIKALDWTESFVNLYNSWNKTYCDPYFRSIQQVEPVGPLMNATSMNPSGEGRLLMQPGGRWLYQPIKVRARGKTVSARGRALRARGSDASLFGSVDAIACECPQDKVRRLPNVEDFVEEYNSTVISLDIANVDGIADVVEPDVFTTTLRVEMVIEPVRKTTWSRLIKFNINIVNTGAWTAENVLLVDALPIEGTLLSSRPTGKVDDSILTIEIGDLIPGEEVQVNVRWLTPLETEFLDTVATVSADNAEETSKVAEWNLGRFQDTEDTGPCRFLGCCDWCGDDNLFDCDGFCTPIDCGTAECCSNSDCSPGTQTCVFNACISKGNPRFTLTWYGEDDLDIHVITPGGFHIYWLQPNDNTSGGELDHDDTPQAIGRHIENIAFPSVGAPTGTYQYYVRSLCRSCNGDEWKISVFLGDVEPYDFTQKGTGDSAYFNFTL